MITIKWALTNDCNLRCRTCYNADYYSHEEFPFKRVPSLLQEMNASQVNRIDLLGGEPMKYSRFEDFCEQAILAHIPLTMSTNATLINPKRGELYKAAFSEITVSLDGFTKEHNDEIRGSGVYDRVMESLDFFAENGIAVNINCTLSQKAMSGITNLSTLLGRHQNIKAVSLGVPFQVGRAGSKSNCNLWLPMPNYFENIDEFYRTNLEIFSEIDISFSAPPLIQWYFDRKYGINKYAPLHDYCMGGSFVYYIDASGIVLPCNLPYGRRGMEEISGSREYREEINLAKQPLFTVLSNQIYNSFFGYVRRANESMDSWSECMSCPFFQKKYCAPRCPFMQKPRETAELCWLLLEHCGAHELFNNAEAFLQEFDCDET